MPLHPAVHQVHALHQGIGPAPVDHQLAVPLHRPQALAQRIQILGFMQGKPRGNALLVQGALCLVKQVKYHFPAGNGVVVTGRLAGSVGVGNLAFFGHSLGFFRERIQ